MLSDKKLERIEKILGADKIEELNDYDVNLLSDVITGAEMAVKQAQDELDANPKYQDIKASLKALREGVSDLKKRQNALVQYSLHLLEEKGPQ